MTARSVARVRRVIPFVLILLGVMWLIGCIYIPTSEHPDDPNQFDFRPLFRGAHPPIRISVTAQSDLPTILGNNRHTLHVDDRKLEVNTFETDQGLWVNLCGESFSTVHTRAFLAVLYNDRGIVTDWQFIEMPAGKGIYSDVASKLKPTLRDRLLSKAGRSLNLNASPTSKPSQE